MRECAVDDVAEDECAISVAGDGSGGRGGSRRGVLGVGVSSSPLGVRGRGFVREERGEVRGRSGVVGGERRARGGRRGNGRRHRPFRPTPLPRRVPGHAARARALRALTIRHPRDVVQTRCAKNGSGGGFTRLRPASRPARARLAAERVGASETRASVQPRRPQERARRSRTVRRTPSDSRDTNARVLSLESRSGEPSSAPPSVPTADTAARPPPTP